MLLLLLKPFAFVLLYFAGVFVVLGVREVCAAGVRRSDVMAKDAAVVMRDAEAGRVCWTTRANGRGYSVILLFFLISLIYALVSCFSMSLLGSDFNHNLIVLKQNANPLSRGACDFPQRCSGWTNHSRLLDYLVIS